MALSSQWNHLTPYDKHKALINELLLTRKGATKLLTRDSSKDRRDIDIIKENHKFLWDEETDVADSWEKRLAKKYYDKLFKEYCICDLSKFKENKVAMRWRTDKELIEGKGQFVCGEKKCIEKEALRTWEVNFAYIEEHTKKNALVKLRLCIDCSYKLNYHSKKREVKKIKGKRKNYMEDSKNKKVKTKVVSDDSVMKNESNEVSTQSSSQTTEESFWSNLSEEKEEKSKESEFQDYLDDLFL